MESHDIMATLAPPTSPFQKRIAKAGVLLVLVPLLLALCNLGIGNLTGRQPVELLIQSYCGADYLAVNDKGVLNESTCGFDEPALLALFGIGCVILGSILLAVLWCFQILRLLLLRLSR